MVDTAAYLVDRVFPDVPVRQWVLSLPYALWYRLAYDASAVSPVLRVFVRAIFESQRRRARDNGIHNTQCGAVTFIQRFGSALNLNVHFHVIVLDGVYACTEEEEKTRFYPLRPPENADVLKVATRVAMRTAALIEGPEQSDHLEREQPGLSALYGASLCGRIATGPNAGQRVKTTGDAIDGERDEVSGSRCATVWLQRACRGGHSGGGSPTPGTIAALCGTATGGNRPFGSAPRWAPDISTEDSMAQPNNPRYF
jgi:hypothetical protein